MAVHVTASYDGGSAALPDAVRAKCSALKENNNVCRANGGVVYGLDNDHVPCAKSREHAIPCDSQPGTSALPKEV